MSGPVVSGGNRHTPVIEEWCAECAEASVHLLYLGSSIQGEVPVPNTLTLRALHFSL